MKKENKILMFIVSIISVLALSINLGEITDLSNSYALETNVFSDLIEELRIAFNGFGLINMCLVFIVYKFYLSNYTTNNKFRLIAICFSIFTLLGKTCFSGNDLSIIFKSVVQSMKYLIAFAGYYFIFKNCINYIFNYIIKIKPSKKFNKYVFDKKIFLTTFIIILIGWLPYIIFYFPGLTCSDTMDQLTQYAGEETYTSSIVNKIDDDVYLNDHHPVFHTFLIGSSINLFRNFTSDNVALFIVCFIQVLLCIAVLAYSLKTFKRWKVPNMVLWIILLIYTFNPIFPGYAYMLIKDVPFTALSILYVLFLIDLIINPKELILNKKKTIAFIFDILLLMLIRHNGLYMILVSLPFIFVFIRMNKNLKKRLLFITLLPLMLFFLYSKILLPWLSVSPSSIKESLALQFQQTARYVSKYDSELSTSEKLIINEVLDYSRIKSIYNEDSADYIKSIYKTDASKEELKAYLKLWIKQFNNHPLTCIEATLKNTYGYLYPGYTDYIIWNGIDQNDVKETPYSFYNPSILDNYRKTIEYNVFIILNIPIVGLLLVGGFYAWILLMIISFLKELREYKYIIATIPGISILINCLLSPVNGHTRYVLPLIVMTPTLICLLIKLMIERQDR